MQFPLRSDPAFSEETNRAVLRDAGAPARARVKAALNLAFIERVQAGRPLELSCLALGGIRILHLPGEPFVEYQLWAQRAFPQWFVAVADLCDSAPLYLCTDEAYRDNGGYEQTMSFVDPSELFCHGIDQGSTRRRVGKVGLHRHRPARRCTYAVRRDIRLFA